jgi:hypothetical protein
MNVERIRRRRGWKFEVNGKGSMGCKGESSLWVNQRNIGLLSNIDGTFHVVDDKFSINKALLFSKCFFLSDWCLNSGLHTC